MQKSQNTEIDRNKIDDKKKESFRKKLNSAAEKMLAVNYNEPGHTSLIVKAKFYAVRMLQTGLGK